MPDHIREVFRNQNKTRKVLSNLPIERGQLRILQSSSGNKTDQAVVLILKVNSEREFCEVMLSHSHIDLATGVDVVIPPDSQTIAYGMVIQTDCHGVVWTKNLGKIIGNINDEAFEALSTVSAGGFPTGPYLPGVDLGGPLDQRWSFKVEQGKIMVDLSKQCMTALLEEPDANSHSEKEELETLNSLLVRLKLNDNKEQKFPEEHSKPNNNHEQRIPEILKGLGVLDVYQTWNSHEKAKKVTESV